MKPIVTFDEYGTPLCPLAFGSWEWNEAETDKVYTQGTCGAEMALFVMLNISPGEGDPLVKPDDFTNANANTSSWDFRCQNGHVLATSCEDENAEAFDLRDHLAPPS